MAAFARRPNSRSLLPRAEALYGRAIKKINLVLRDHRLVLRDSTLASILLFGIFETITSTHLAMSGWLSHLDGAITILKSRGKKQIETPVGRDLFYAIRGQMVLAVIANSRYVDAGIEWWIDMIPQDETQRVITELNLRLGNLRAETEKLMLSSPYTSDNLENVSKLLHEAKLLDERYAQWFENLPPSWKPRTVAWIDSIREEDLLLSDFYPGRVDLLVEIWSAGQYATALTSRLLVQRTILRCAARLCSPLDYRLTPEFTTAARVSSQLIDDVIAAVPYFFGWKPKTDVGAIVTGSNFACGKNDGMTPKALSVLFVIWPIIVAATSDFTTESHREWLKAKLAYVSEHMGINQAGVLLKNAAIRSPSMLIFRDKNGHTSSIFQEPPV
ncbi:hypothetical protein BP6252_01834 [Coleophoma cylindrospora]|uniref:Uncharacterized protein n=1 Tax=Coleophoma cylindrospora TaxID=1849047 RepID=A0A3D8SDR0_9HELO|nr:hypothetical protein BP6252_01834 [Coleophoma cylindrospora]